MTLAELAVVDAEPTEIYAVSSRGFLTEPLLKMSELTGLARRLVVENLPRVRRHYAHDQLDQLALHDRGSWLADRALA
jgi:hypothetical protein